VAKHLGIDLHEVNVDLVDKQQLRPEFLKVSPEYSVEFKEFE
jgi:glutathione S-transferase